MGGNGPDLHREGAHGHARDLRPPHVFYGSQRRDYFVGSSRTTPDHTHTHVYEVNGAGKPTDHPPINTYRSTDGIMWNLDEKVSKYGGRQAQGDSDLGKDKDGMMQDIQPGSPSEFGRMLGRVRSGPRGCHAAKGHEA